MEVDDDLVVMAMLVDRRDELGQARTQTINPLHKLLLQLFPVTAGRAGVVGDPPGTPG